ncbi:MAG: hypothetical protein AAFR44_02730 [Pseudomonadota bacterium]
MMQDDTSRELSPAVARLRRYGWVSTAVGGVAVTLCVLLLGFTQQYTAMTGIALVAMALQILALVVLFFPAFGALRAELRDGSVRVDPAREKAAMGKLPWWLTAFMVAWLAIEVARLVLLGASLNISLFMLMFVAVLLATRGWPTGETMAQRAKGAAALGMFGLMLSMMPGMMAGGYLARIGAIDVPQGVALLGFAALMVVPAMFVFFSTINIIGRAGHAH